MDLLRRALLLALALSVAAPFGPGVALASCVQESAVEQAARADVIVVGTVTETRQTFVAAGGVIRFRPERVLKGTLTTVVQVYLGPSHGNSATSVDYSAATTGERHTLYLRTADDGSYETNACSGSHAGPLTADEDKLFGAGTLVTAPTDDSGRPAIIVAIVVVLALGAAAILVLLRRRSAS